MNRETLQSHCDNIISLLEKAVQLAVSAKHFPSDNPADEQAAVQQARLTYLQTVKSLYDPEDMPAIYEQIYKKAIARPSGHSTRSDENGPYRDSIAYTINAGRIVRQLNKDFLPNQPRDCWVSYSKPHLDCIGKVTRERIGDPNYRMAWLEDSADDFEQNIVYLDLNKASITLTYAVIDPKGKLKAGDISFHQILELSLNDPQFINPEQESVYAEIEVDKGKVSLKKTIPFSDLKEENVRTMTLQETSTAIIDRLVDAVYAAIYAGHSKKSVRGHARTTAEKDVQERYTFYMDTVKNLYLPNPVPEVFDMIYQIAIDNPTYSITIADHKLLRYPIQVGRILTQLNHDFILTNTPSLVYDKPYLGFRGKTLRQPLGGKNYQPISFKKHPDGLSYRVRDPQGSTKTGRLTLDHILEFLGSNGRQLLESDGAPDIYVFAETVRTPSTEYCYSFLMHILSHPMTQFVAIALLVIGAVLAYSGTAVGVGITMAAVGGGLLLAGFFAPKNTQEDEPKKPNFTPPGNEECTNNWTLC
jgi:hypothetical protein